MTVSKYGKWPGVVAFANDAHLSCVECSAREYGEKAIAMVVWGKEGYEQYTDHEGNPLNPILYGSEDLHGQYCEGAAHQGLLHRGLVTPEDLRLCDDDCVCYQREDIEAYKEEHDETDEEEEEA